MGAGFGWASSDELKMQDSFGLGAAELFRHFVDVRHQAEVMGYHNYSLGSLSKQLLGFHPPASKEASSSCRQTHLLFLLLVLFSYA